MSVVYRAGLAYGFSVAGKWYEAGVFPSELEDYEEVEGWLHEQGYPDLHFEAGGNSWSGDARWTVYAGKWHWIEDEQPYFWTVDGDSVPSIPVRAQLAFARTQFAPDARIGWTVFMDVM